MKPVLPVKDLVRTNWVLIIVFSTAVLLFLIVMLDETEVHKLAYAAMTALGLGLVSFANVFILIELARRFTIQSRQFRLHRFLWTYLASLCIYILLAPVFDFVSPKSYSYSYLIYLFVFVLASLVVNTVVIIVHDFVILQSVKTSADLEFSRLKTAHAEASNLLLKQQIQPHFLFNALTTLKALYRKDLDKGDSYIVHLANFLRASIQNHTAKVFTLEEELNILDDYLEMQRIRFGYALTCEVNIPEEIRKCKYLPAFALQPLLENAIKHNELTSIAPLNVQLYCDNGYIIVRNNLKRRYIIPPSTNFGLANLAERYRLLSGDEIIVDEEEHYFTVSIKLLSDEYCNH